MKDPKENCEDCKGTGEVTTEEHNPDQPDRVYQEVCNCTLE